jgi:membrane protein involved in D-alanine export
MAFFIAIAWVCKLFCADKQYKYILFSFNALFLVIFYPKPLHFLLLIVLSYLLTAIIKFKRKLFGIILLLIPMLLVKLDIRFDFYPFELNNWISFAGLSYASFRIMSYYMDKSPDEKVTDFFTYFNFLAFVPTLLIGPIDRLSRFAHSQNSGFTHLNDINFLIGVDALVKGIAFKYVFAELVDRYWLHTFDASATDFLNVASNMYGYYFYLFFDFAGYSHMALGIGKMLGINMPLNFTNPFVAVNPQDFWKRFHISLGDWLKDYFFTPLYMYFSRKKSLKAYPLMRQNISLFLTFLLMGCWNGFKFNFVLSGAIFGIFSVVHNTYVTRCKQSQKDLIFGNMNANYVKIISIFIMFNLVAFALYIFSGRCPFI